MLDGTPQVHADDSIYEEKQAQHTDNVAQRCVCNITAESCVREFCKLG
jgi:hypothetical protein